MKATYGLQALVRKTSTTDFRNRVNQKASTEREEFAFAMVINDYCRFYIIIRTCHHAAVRRFATHTLLYNA